jgi:NAD(P)-dependent dehydrogenase (short-subunit alcohol dehydrogenase family)
MFYNIQSKQGHITQRQITRSRIPAHALSPCSALLPTPTLPPKALPHMTHPPQVALIQGASGGIGGALAARALASGRFSRVILTSRDPQTSLPLTDERITALRLDLTSDDSIEEAAGRVREVSGALHLVITTAGLLHDEARGITPEKSLNHLRRSSLQALFDVNCAGPFLWYRALMPTFRHRDPLTIATLSARVGSISDNELGGWYGYRASKAAQNMMTKTLSLELRRVNPNATVVGLHPGTVQTPLSEPFHGRVPASQLLTPARSAEALWGVLEGLSPAQSGRCFAWDGAEVLP